MILESLLHRIIDGAECIGVQFCTGDNYYNAGSSSIVMPSEVTYAEAVYSLATVKVPFTVVYEVGQDNYPILTVYTPIAYKEDLLAPCFPKVFGFQYGDGPMRRDDLGLTVPRSLVILNDVVGKRIGYYARQEIVSAQWWKTFLPGMTIPTYVVPAWSIPMSLHHHCMLYLNSLPGMAVDEPLAKTMAFTSIGPSEKDSLLRQAEWEGD